MILREDDEPQGVPGAWRFLGLKANELCHPGDPEISASHDVIRHLRMILAGRLASS